MDRHKEKRLPPTPSGDRGNLDLGLGELRVSGGGGNPGILGSPLGEGAYSHPRTAPLPPAPPAQASSPLTSPTFPLSPLPGLNDYTQPRHPLRLAPWRTPTSPPRPPPGRLLERKLLSPNPQLPAQKGYRSGSLPSINFSRREAAEQQLPRLPRPVTPHPSHGVRSPPSQYARSAIPPVPPAPVMFSPAAAAAVGFQLHRQQPSSTFSPPIPEKSPRRSLVENNSTSEKRSSTASRELDLLEEQLVGLRVPLGEPRRGEYHGEARRGEYNREARRKQSTNSIYSQGSEEQGSVYAETYHGFMFGDHPHGEPSHKGHLNRPSPEREGDNKQNRREPTTQLFCPTRTTPRTPSPGPPLESHYNRRPNTSIAPRASRLEGRHRGEVDPIRTITATRIARKPAKLRPVSTQQALRTPSPLSATLKGPGPHVPDVNGDDTGSSGSDGGIAGRPMFARELTASPEVMSSVAVEEDEEDERRGMVSRWSMDSSDLSDGEVVDVEVMEGEVSPVSGSPTREGGREAEQESAQKPLEEYHEAQEVARETSSAQDSSSSSNSEPSSSSQENEGTEPEKSEEPILPFDNLTNQLADLQESLNHLVCQATSVEAAFDQVREAMIALRQKATETLVDVEQFLEEIQGVERQLRELRRTVKGKGKEKEVVHSGAGERQGTREQENSGQGERNDRHKGDKFKQRRELKQGTEEEKKHQPETSPDASPKGPPRRPPSGPPSGPAPGGAEWV